MIQIGADYYVIKHQTILIIVKYFLLNALLLEKWYSLTDAISDDTILQHFKQKYNFFPTIVISENLCHPRYPCSIVITSISS